MRSVAFAGIVFLFASSAFCQSDRGTITGTVADPAGAAVASAAIQARNVETGAVYDAASTATGNYALSGLPAGTYEVSVSVAGFKKYIRQGLVVQAAQTFRIDIGLEIGNASESVTVTEAVPLLKTESGELSHVVETDRMDRLPILQTGATAGSGGIRNPFSITALLPGSAFVSGQTGPNVRINGGVNNSEIVLIEGMDATNSLGQGASQQNQPGTDSIQEWAIQTSNFAAEYGQVGNAIMNVTMKSGTNQFHGSAYDYYVNEFMNAGQPFTNDGQGHLVRPEQRRNDYGFTIGGPVRIPKLYNGQNKTFFFFSWEQYRITQNILPNALTVPTAAFRTGDFSGAELLTKSLGNDPLNRPIFGNEIYDPTTRRAVGSQIVTDPFPNNKIPVTSFDPVAVKIQNLIPNPTNSALLLNNYQKIFLSHRNTEVPSVKIDHVLGPKDKLSFFWNMTKTYCKICSGTGGSTGLPETIDTSTQTDIHAYSVRLNYDRTIAPTVLLHLGAGFSQNWLGRPPIVPDYDAPAQLGLNGPFTKPATFPVLQVLCTQVATVCTGQGGMANMGTTAGAVSDVFQQPSGIASVTWVKNNHTFKFGAETRIQGDYNLNAGALNGTYTFSNAETALPYVRANSPTSSVAGQPIGFNYASFLLGLVDIANAKPPSKGRIGKSQWGFYVQDNWKVTRKLTLDIGLRYDYSTYLKEQYGRTPTLAPNLANPSAGGHPGAVQYEATCNCNFANNYKFGFGPRFGLAYQISSKTVLRAGFGIVYTGTPQYNLSGAVAAASNPVGPNPDLGSAIMRLSTGVPLTPAQIVWPNFNPGYYPINSAATPVGGGPPNVVDQNAGRPGRQYQWSIGLQHEVVRNLLVEASYVANRAVWLTAASLVNYNALTPQVLSSYGLSLSNPADIAILTAPLNSAAAGRFQNKLPYSGFQVTQTVAQSLRPFPQFNSGLAAIWSPLGKTWYDSLQLKATKRFSHGLDFTYAFTWSKELDNISGAALPTDVQNYGLSKTLSANSRPFISGLGVNYTVPGWGGNKVLRYAVRDWTIGGFLQYSSGLPIAPPAANLTPNLNSILFQNTVQNRVPGVAPFTQDLNCHCFDPNTNFVLNPAAWTNPAPGTFGSAIYYNDYRQQRRPLENVALGRQFRMREKMSLNVRIEFTNIFNRTFINNPSSTNPQQQQVKNGAQTTSGFGFIDTTSVFSAPRQGQLVAQFRF
jgi:Carboxypeptidase regulatory-like domain/TonB dependent receptor